MHEHRCLADTQAIRRSRMRGGFVSEALARKGAAVIGVDPF